MGTSPVTAELLRRVESLLALVGVAVAAIVPALLPDGTFPFQMRGLAASSSAVATVAFLLALSYPEAAVSRRRSTSILAAACGVMLVALNVFLVVHIEVGEPPEEVAYLTGWAYTQTGLTELERAGIDPRQFSRAEVVEEVGYDRAPRLGRHLLGERRGLRPLHVGTHLHRRVRRRRALRVSGQSRGARRPCHGGPATGRSLTADRAEDRDGRSPGLTRPSARGQRTRCECWISLAVARCPHPSIEPPRPRVTRGLGENDERSTYPSSRSSTRAGGDVASTAVRSSSDLVLPGGAFGHEVAVAGPARDDVVADVDLDACPRRRSRRSRTDGCGARPRCRPTRTSGGARRTCRRRGRSGPCRPRARRTSRSS